MASRALLERNDINILVGAAVDADLFDINRDLHWGGIDRRIKQSVKTGQSRLEQFELDLSALNRRSWATQLSSFLDNIASLLRTRNLEQSKIFDDYVRQ